MMGKATIYHNPRCSKSRICLQMIQDWGHEAEVIEYLKEPPTADTLDALCRAMGKEPVEIVRVKDAKFKDLSIPISDLENRNQCLKLMAANPAIIERPIVIFEGQVVLGRPPEVLQDIL
jgi:arsenate reductase